MKVTSQVPRPDVWWTACCEHSFLVLDDDDASTHFFFVFLDSLQVMEGLIFLGNLEGTPSWSNARTTHETLVCNH